MSHIVTYQASFVDMNCLERCCKRNSFEFLTNQEENSGSFTGGTVCKCAVKLPGWTFPIYVDQEGSVHYDNYNGKWGSWESLDKLKQEYAREACYMQAESQGYFVENESYTADGKLVMELVQY